MTTDAPRTDRSHAATQVSRRSIARTAAWAVPTVVVGAPAPALAASACPPISYKIDWGTNPYTRSSGRAGSITTADPAGAATAVTMTVSASYTGNMTDGSETKGNNNLTVEPGVVGGSYNGGLTIIQTLTGPQSNYQRSARGVYTFNFTAGGKPITVTGLSFTITDIDSTDGDFLDTVELSGAFTLGARGSLVTGNATTASPAKANALNSPQPNTSGAGNLAVTYPGPLSSFALTYWNSMDAFSGVDRDQGIYISDMTFMASSC